MKHFWEKEWKKKRERERERRSRLKPEVIPILILICGQGQRPSYTPKANKACEVVVRQGLGGVICL